MTRIQQGAALMRKWGIGDEIEEDPVLGEGDVALFEHLLHEVAHAQILRIEGFNEETPNLVGEAIRVLDKVHGTIVGHGPYAIAHEEQAWAIEWHLWKTFRLRDRFSWDDLTAQAAIQGAKEESIREAIDQPHIKYFAKQAVKEVRRLCALGAELPNKLKSKQ